MSKGIRIFLVILVSIVLLYISLLLAGSFLFSGRSIYLIPLLVTTLSLIVYLYIKIVNKGSSRICNFFLVGSLILLIFVILYKESPRIYGNYVGKVGNEINLRDYAPFEPDTKAVQLSEFSSLRITEDLPRLDGATALYPIYSAFAQAVYPEAQYNPWSSVVRCSKTGRAYENLFENKADIIFAAAPSKEHTEYAKSQGLTLELTPIGYEAFVFFVNKKNPIEGLTIQQVRDIYSGEITNWNQVSGKEGKIIAFQRPANSGSQTMLERVMASHPIMEPQKEEVVDGMGGIIHRAAEYTNYKNSIGYSFLFFTTRMVANKKIRILKIEGVEPSQETIKNKKYPFSGQFYAITVKEHRSNKNVDTLIKWVLSSQGQEIVKKTGYLSL